ncbi:MAG TPA: hypothetical protein VK579_20115 [Terriglobales bacterium]|nr:hypothetical protein [Terriglobales bacterium]
MRRNSIFRLRYLSVLPLCLAVSAQIVSSNQPVPQGAVAYSSVNQLNGMLSQLEQASQAAQLDLAKLRIDKWKVDSGSKRQTQSNVESVQRNLQAALPEMIAELKTSPENLNSTFKLYRNLDALYNVFGSVAESTGAFGSKDEFQTLENDLSEFEKARHAFADRMESLAGAKEAEVNHLRAALQSAQASASSQPPKKIVVDDEAPAKKPAKKKAATKPNPAPLATPVPAAKPQ